MLFSMGISVVGCPFIQCGLNAQCPLDAVRDETKGRLMLKRIIRWILPLVVLVVIATYFVLSPVLASHAAGPATPYHVTAPQFLFPDFFVRH